MRRPFASFRARLALYFNNYTILRGSNPDLLIGNPFFMHVVRVETYNEKDDFTKTGLLADCLKKKKSP